MYDAEGRLSELVTTREPEWDEVDRALIDAFQNWRADIHVCGRPLSESLDDPDDDEREDPDYQVGVETCLACQALDRAQAKRHAGDKALLDAGRNPESWRVATVLPIAALDPADRTAILEARKRTHTPTD